MSCNDWKKGDISLEVFETWHGSALALVREAQDRGDAYEACSVTLKMDPESEWAYRVKWRRLKERKTETLEQRVARIEEQFFGW